MRKIYAAIDNKDLMEDGLEDEMFQDFFPATDHRKRNVRHMVGSVAVSEKNDQIQDCLAYVDVRWHFGDAAITITMLACNPCGDSDEEQCKVLFDYYEVRFKEWEQASKDNAFDESEYLHIDCEREGYQMKVVFWWREE